MKLNNSNVAILHAKCLPDSSRYINAISTEEQIKWLLEVKAHLDLVHVSDWGSSSSRISPAAAAARSPPLTGSAAPNRSVSPRSLSPLQPLQNNADTRGPPCLPVWSGISPGSVSLPVRSALPPGPVRSVSRSGPLRLPVQAAPSPGTSRSLCPTLKHQTLRDPVVISLCSGDGRDENKPKIAEPSRAAPRSRHPSHTHDFLWGFSQ